MRSFVALHTFESPETKSVYAQGFSYTIKDGDHWLNALAEFWAADGRIKFTHTLTHAHLRGNGFAEPTIWQKTQEAYYQFKKKWSHWWR